MVAQLGAVRAFPAQNLKCKIAVLAAPFLSFAFSLSYSLSRGGLVSCGSHGAGGGIRLALFPLSATVKLTVVR